MTDSHRPDRIPRPSTSTEEFRLCTLGTPEYARDHWPQCSCFIGVRGPSFAAVEGARSVSSHAFRIARQRHPGGRTASIPAEPRGRATAIMVTLNAGKGDEALELIDRRHAELFVDRTVLDVIEHALAKLTGARTPERFARRTSIRARAPTRPASGHVVPMGASRAAAPAPRPGQRLSRLHLRRRPRCPHREPTPTQRLPSDPGRAPSATFAPRPGRRRQRPRSLTGGRASTPERD